jgi:hypothetical protein
MTDFGGGGGSSIPVSSGFQSITDPSSNYNYTPPASIAYEPVPAPYTPPAPVSNPFAAEPFPQQTAAQGGYSPTAYGGNNGGGVFQQQGGAATSGVAATPAAPPKPPPPPDFNKEALVDGTFTKQRGEYNKQLANYVAQLQGQIGSGDLIGKSGPGDASSIDTLWTEKGLGHDGHALYKQGVDSTGQNTYDSTNAIGGSMGSAFNTALANFGNSRNQGLGNMWADYSARGLGQSGVAANGIAEANNQYQNQLGNLSNGTLGQYQDLGTSLNNQVSNTQNQIQAARGDAAARLQAAYTNNLPTGTGA